MSKCGKRVGADASVKCVRVHNHNGQCVATMPASWEKYSTGVMENDDKHLMVKACPDCGKTYSNHCFHLDACSNGEQVLTVEMLKSKARALLLITLSYKLEEAESIREMLAGLDDDD